MGSFHGIDIVAVQRTCRHGCAVAVAQRQVLEVVVLGSGYGGERVDKG